MFKTLMKGIDKFMEYEFIKWFLKGTGKCIHFMYNEIKEGSIYNKKHLGMIELAIAIVLAYSGISHMK